MAAKRIPILLALAAVIVYANSFGGAFVLDDDQNIERNPNIATVQRVIHNMTEGVERPLRDRPLLELSLAFNHGLSGKEVWSYHLVNLLIHVAAGWMLFAVARRTLRLPVLGDRFAAHADWIAGAIALIWTVHPLQTQSVTYIVQRGEALMGLFYLSAVYCLLRSDRSSRPVLWYVLLAVSCALGMASKGVMISVPLVLVLFDRIFLSESFRQVFERRWKAYAGVLLALVIVGAGTRTIAENVGATASAGPAERYIGTPGRAQNAMEYWRTQPEVLLHYVKLGFWPADLCLDYKWLVQEDTTRIAITSLILLALLGATLWALVYHPPWGFLGAWFFVILAPTSLVWRLELAFEHRMYLPLAALVSLVVLGAYEAGRRWGLKPVVAVVALSLVTVALGARSIVRNNDYAGRETMYRAVLEVRPENPRALYNLGNALAREARELRNAGEADEARRHLEEAIELYQRSIAADPGGSDVRVNMGLRLADLGRYDDAIDSFRAAVEAKPDHPAGLYNLGRELRVHGNRLLAEGKTAEAQELFVEAVGAYRRSVEVRPEHVNSHYGLGESLRLAGQTAEAEQALRRTLTLDPQNAYALRSLGEILLRRGAYLEAQRVVVQSLQIDSSNQQGRALLEQLQAVLGKP